MGRCSQPKEFWPCRLHACALRRHHDRVETRDQRRVIVSYRSLVFPAQRPRRCIRQARTAAGGEDDFDTRLQVPASRAQRHPGEPARITESRWESDEMLAEENGEASCDGLGLEPPIYKGQRRVQEVGLESAGGDHGLRRRPHLWDFGYLAIGGHPLRLANRLGCHQAFERQFLLVAVGVPMRIRAELSVAQPPEQRDRFATESTAHANDRMGPSLA